MVGDGLLAVELGSKIGVEAQEVDSLARAVDFGLHGALALAQHTGGVQDIAVFGGEQLGGLHHDGSALDPGSLLPVLLGGHGCVDGHLHLLGAHFVVFGQHVVVLGGHHHLTHVTGADFLTADDQRNLNLLIVLSF